MAYRDLITVSFSFDNLLEKLANGEKFSFARYGDGEFAAMIQSRKKGAVNCDGHQFFPDMGEALLRTLIKKPDYYIGLQALAYRQHEQTIIQWTNEYGLWWCDSDILHKANINGRIPEFVAAIKEHKVLLVGSVHLHPFAIENGWYFCKVPSKDCWLEYENIRAEIAVLTGVYDLTILYCASMMSEVLISDFHGRATQVDAGSVFDIHVGLISRNYMNNLKV